MATTLIYDPKGKAKEYIPDGYALNIYKGCTFGCTYCFSPRVMHETKELYHAGASPRKNFREKIIKELPQYKGKKVFMSFISDPFQPCEDEYKLTEFVLGEMLLYDVIPVILTKGIVSETVFELITSFKEVYFGCTLITPHDDIGIEWEPKAPLPSLRIAQLERFFSAGVSTWVSLEPVIYPVHSLEAIEDTHEFVNEYKIGKLNYNEEQTKGINWGTFTRKAIALCDKYHVEYYIKESLKKYL